MPKGRSFAVFTLTTETFWMSIVKCLQKLQEMKKHFDYWFMLLGSPDGSESKTSACSTGDQGLIPVSGRSPGEENGSPIKYACLENSMDRGAWWATIHGFAKCQTQLDNQHFHFHMHLKIAQISESPGTLLNVEIPGLHVTPQKFKLP